MNDLISIVLPVYNGERFLQESIESVLKQTYQNWELLVLDDCSTDNTAAIVKEYVEIDSRIKYYKNEKNLRLPRNLNKGFSLANGQYLTWTSDDNRFRPQALEKMKSMLEKNPQVDLVYASYQIMDESGKEIMVLMADESGKEHILGSNVVGACFMYTRKAYEEVGDYDSELVLVEDFDYWQRMFIKFETIAIKDILYDYRWHEKSLTSTKKQEEFSRVMEKMLLKNRPGFGKISLEASYYFYQCLHKNCKNSRNYRNYVIKYRYYCLMFNARRILGRILR